MLVKTEKVNCIICNKDNDIHGQGIDYEFKTCTNLWSTKYCEECDHYYLDNRPNIADSNIIYPPDYYPAINDPNFIASIILKVRYLIEKWRYKSLMQYFSEDPCIVDVGAGDGRVLGYLRAIFGPKIRLIAVDLDIAEDTKQFFSDNDIIYFETVIEAFNFEENVGAADIIIMTQVIEHLWEPIKVIEKIKEILTPKGIIFIETPNPNSLCKKVQGSQYWGGWHRPRHINVFTRKSLTLIVEKLNMKVVKYKEYVVPAFWVMGVRNFLGLGTNGQNRSIFNFISLKNIFTLIFFTLIEACVGLLKLGLSNHRFIISKRESDD